jgi:hypothetical protein
MFDKYATQSDLGNTPISYMELIQVALSISSPVSTFCMAKSCNRLLNDNRAVMYEVLKSPQLQSWFEQVFLTSGATLEMADKVVR